MQHEEKPDRVPEEDHQESVRSLDFKVFGIKPVAMPRPRFAKGRVFSNSTRANAWKGAVRCAALEAMAACGWIATGSPLSLRLVFQFKRPKSHYTNKGLLKSEAWHMPHRPDIDNLSKAVMDALNEVAYTDDSQIVALDAMKIYGPDEGVLVCLKTLQRGNTSPCNQQT